MDQRWTFTIFRKKKIVIIQKWRTNITSFSKYFPNTKSNIFLYIKNKIKIKKLV